MSATATEVVIPGSRESDAAKARAALELAGRTRRKADAAAATVALRWAGTWVSGSPAWETLRRAAQVIDLRLHQGRPWLARLRELARELDPLLRDMAGEEAERAD